MINVVHLIGNLGKDPEVRNMRNNDNRVASFSIATNDGYFDKDNKWVDRTQWHNIVAWNLLADRAGKMQKGQKVYIQGKITYRDWEDDKGKHYITEIEAQVLRSLDPPKDGDRRPGPTTRTQPARNSGDRQLREPEKTEESGEYDDLPF